MEGGTVAEGCMTTFSRPSRASACGPWRPLTVRIYSGFRMIVWNCLHWANKPGAVSVSADRKHRSACRHPPDRRAGGGRSLRQAQSLPRACRKGRPLSRRLPLKGE